MTQAMELSSTFFTYSDEAKRECSSSLDAPLPTGYNKMPDHLPEKNEYVLMFPPQSPFNVLPTNPPDFRRILEEMFKYFVKTGQILEAIINDCLGLPPNFLNEYNNDRSWDVMLTMRYFSQWEWIPVIPSKGTLVVNLSDSLQVLSNKKFKSATHRVVRPKGRNRHSYVFFYNLQGDKWVEPLPNYLGVEPRYRGFYYKEYQALRLKNKTPRPSTPKESISLTHYEI